jgi:type IX secretion system PorP/SprF family membrane protein
MKFRKYLCVDISGLDTMRKFAGLIFGFIFVFSGSVFCQETNYGPGYQTILVNNPAFAGSNLDGKIRISYLNFYPGNHYNFHSVFLSYDSYFPAIHGGAGFYIANDYLGGIVNDLRSGLSYSYFLRAGRELYIDAGLSASLLHRGFNFNDAVFPDQIDAIGGISLPSSETMTNENTTVFDVGTGFMFIYRRLSGGFAVTHLTQPDLGSNGSSDERLKRKYLLHFIADLDLNKANQLKIRPLASVELQGGYFYASAGAVLSINYLSINSVLLVNNNKCIDIQAGFSFMRDKLALFYNYRFNLGSGNTLMPFSLMHQTGLTFSLNNVEKRIKFKTINMPVM